MLNFNVVLKLKQILRFFIAFTTGAFSFLQSKALLMINLHVVSKLEYFLNCLLRSPHELSLSYNSIKHL